MMYLYSIYTAVGLHSMSAKWAVKSAAISQNTLLIIPANVCFSARVRPNQNLILGGWRHNKVLFNPKTASDWVQTTARSNM